MFAPVRSSMSLRGVKKVRGQGESVYCVVLGWKGDGKYCQKFDALGSDFPIDSVTILVTNDNY